MNKIGTPPQSVEAWLRDFIRETQVAADRNWFKRPWYLGRVSGLKTALSLIERAKGQDFR